MSIQNEKNVRKEINTLKRAMNDETTTIGIKRRTHSKLAKMKKAGEDFDSVINRLISKNVDVYLEFVLIDNELPPSHTAVFQLGEDTKSLYFYDGQKTTPIELKEVQKLLKQPKPNLLLTKPEAEMIFEYLRDTRFRYATHLTTQNILEEGKTLFVKFESFLGVVHKK